MKFLFEHFDILAQAPGGVKKLREMILQFAVQGKLVKQDPNDEPASVLLEKIKEEKERLVKEGKIKRQKPLAPIKEDEIPLELPKGWMWTRLGTILYITSGKNLTTKQMQEGEIPVYGGNGITGYHNAYNVKEKTLVIGRVGFYCGSIHITPDRAWVTDNAFRTVFSEENIDIDFLSILLRTFNLKANENATAQPVISGKKIYPLLLPLAPLAEQKRIVAKVDSLMALCDDLEKQQQKKAEKKLILNKASLHALNNSATKQDFNKNWNHITKNFDLLYSTPKNVNDLKQTILQLAVQGKLVTPACRMAVPACRQASHAIRQVNKTPTSLPKPENGKWFVYVIECEDGSFYKGFTTDLPKRWQQHIRGTAAERTKSQPPKQIFYWEECYSEQAALMREKYLKSGAGREWFKEEVVNEPEDWQPASVLLEKIKEEKERLVKEGKIKKQKPLEPIREDEIPFKLPKDWVWCRLGEVTNYAMGSKIEPNNIDNSTWVLELEDVEKITSKLLKKVRFESRTSKSTKNIFKKGDVIYGKLRPYLDKVIVADEKGVCTTEMIPINGYGYINPYFLRWFLKTPNFIDYANNSTHGINLPRLGKEKARLTPLPLPPLAEQKRIVAKVDTLMTLCDRLSRNLTDKWNKSEKLLNAVVNQL